MAILPSHIYSQNVSGTGTSLFTKKNIALGVEIFRINRPFVSVLDSARLLDTCSNCYLWIPTNVDTAPQDQDKKKKLRACQGCKIVRYCSKDCQAQSWKIQHKVECKIFAKLYPNVLPNTVRIVIQLLLRKKAGSLSDADWRGFLELQSHVADIRSSQTKNDDGLTTWQTVELMSQAASSYSGVDEPISYIQTLTARVLINTHTLTTPTLDPLGLYLSIQSAQLNHSCVPNAAIVFSGPTLILRSLAPIAANTQLFISYIDTTNLTPTRQTELHSRYFFVCKCPACSQGITHGLPDHRPSQEFKRAEARAIGLSTEAARLPAERAGLSLEVALGMLRQYPSHWQPYPSILHTAFLNGIATQSWVKALGYALKAYFYIDPVHYPLSGHPVRVVRKWVLLRLVTQIAGFESAGDSSVKSLEKVEMDWHIVAFGILREVLDGVILSHGDSSPFTTEVRALGQAIGWTGHEKIGEESVEKEWGKLRKLADAAVMES